LFAVGVAVESHASGEKGAEHAAEVGAAGEAGEAGGHTEIAASHAEGATSESFFGIDYEATPFVALAVALSVGLAAGVWLRPDWAPWLAAVALAMLAFAALDVREVVHQLDESRGGLAILAGFVAALHLTAAAVAAVTARSSPAPSRDALA
jgi:hypothetical protein